MQILVESQNQVLQLNESAVMWEASYYQFSFSDMHNTKACCCAFLGHAYGIDSTWVDQYPLIIQRIATDR